MGRLHAPGGGAAATAGSWLVIVLLVCGASSCARSSRPGVTLGSYFWPLLAATVASATGGLLALVWVALKVGALSYGGGFVIIPLMQATRSTTTTG